MPPPRRNLEQTTAQLQRWLSHKLDAPKLQIHNLRGPSETGFSSDTLLFDACWNAAGVDEQAALVARFKPSGFTVFPTYDMARQYHVMRVLGSTDVAVPAVRWLEEDEHYLGVPFFIMDRVDGRVPTDNPPYHSGGWLPELAAAEREALWCSGVEAMARVHRLDWRALGFDFLVPPGAQSLLSWQLDEYRAFIAWGIDAGRYPLLQRAEHWLQAQRPADEPVALCWGDARLGNQIFAGTSCVAVVDWEMVRLGDPVQDLAWWIALDRCFSEGLGIDRLSGLPDRRATVALWESVSGRAARHLEYYEVLSLYKFTAIMARVMLQLMHYELFPADSDMHANNLASVTLQRALDAAGG